MILKNCMKDVIAIRPSTTVREAAKLIIERRAGTLPVVDDNETLVGVVRLPGILKVFMPNFVSLLDNIDFVADFGSLEELHFSDIPEIENITMKKIEFFEGFSLRINKAFQRNTYIGRHFYPNPL